MQGNAWITLVALTILCCCHLKLSLAAVTEHFFKLCKRLWCSIQPRENELHRFQTTRSWSVQRLALVETTLEFVDDITSLGRVIHSSLSDVFDVKKQLCSTSENWCMFEEGKMQNFQCSLLEHTMQLPVVRFNCGVHEKA